MCLLFLNSHWLLDFTVLIHWIPSVTHTHAHTHTHHTHTHTHTHTYWHIRFQFWCIHCTWNIRLSVWSVHGIQYTTVQTFLVSKKKFMYRIFSTYSTHSQYAAVQLFSTLIKKQMFQISILDWFPKIMWQ